MNFRHSLEKAGDDAGRKRIVKDAGFDFDQKDLKAAAKKVAGDGGVAPRSSATWTSTSASAASAASAAAAAL